MKKPLSTDTLNLVRLVGVFVAGRVKYLLALIGTVLFWGTSFPAIKYLMYFISEYTYTWVRGLFSIMFLLPYILWRIRQNTIERDCIIGGIYAGIFYSMGLWFQAWGTRFTTASKSAFITGLNVPFVHFISAIMHRSYSRYLGISLLLALSGLYLLTVPADGFSPRSFGDLLVLISAVMWALQILIVDRYSKCDPFVFIFFMFTPTLLFSLYDIVSGNISGLSFNTIILGLLIYLALFCNIAAFSLQVYGQRKIRPEASALIFLLEPVFSMIFSHILLGENMNANQIAGAVLILLSMYTASKHMYK